MATEIVKVGGLGMSAATDISATGGVSSQSLELGEERHTHSHFLCTHVYKFVHVHSYKKNFFVAMGRH